NEVRYDEVPRGLREAPRITDWRKAQAISTCKYAVWEDCLEVPGRHLEAEQAILDTVSAGHVQHRLSYQRVLNGTDMLEVFDYPASYAHRFDGIDKDGTAQTAELQKIFADNQRTARIRMEQEAAGCLSAEGVSDAGHFLPGHRFTLARHFSGSG